jgi:hypothetical protein
VWPSSGRFKASASNETMILSITVQAQFTTVTGGCIATQWLLKDGVERQIEWQLENLHARVL